MANWLRREISAEILRDEAEIRRIENRFHAHTFILACGMVACGALFTIGADQYVIFLTWFLTGCQEYTDYYRRF